MAEDEGSAAKRKRAIEQIATADWEALRLRLAKFAGRYLRGAFPRGAPGGKTAMLYVHDAIWKVLEGVHATDPLKSTESQRQWDPDTHSLFGTLCFGIASDINNDVEQHNRQQRLLKADQSTIGMTLPNPPTPPHIAAEDSEERQGWLNAFADRPLAREIARVAMDEGIYTARELAARLGVERKVVYNEKKRMKERAEERAKERVKSIRNRRR